MSVGGGRAGWARLALIAVGIGVGVVMLLLVSSLPSVIDARSARTAARDTDSHTVAEAADDTMLVATVRSGFRELGIEGHALQPEGPAAPLPPGVDRALDPGEVVLSPALARLMASSDGESLRGRWGDRVVGTIGAEGLAGPGELTFYLGADDLTDETSTRIDGFGTLDAQGGGVGPELVLLGLVGLAVLVVPVASFIATAVRFGGEARDRRLAALRLVGADAGTTRRIAAGETMVGALVGLAVGWALLLVVQRVVPSLMPPTMSFYQQDLRPVPLLAALVVVGVPVASVLVTVSAMRRVLVEPLGVVRRASITRRRLWWRLAVPVLGLVLLVPLADGMATTVDELMVVVGLILLLTGIALLLPWIVDAVVRRLGPGGVAWELAVRRLQLDSGTAVRAVSAIVVSVAGLIALQGTFSGILSGIEDDHREDTAVFQAEIFDLSADATDHDWAAGLSGAPGVRDVETSLVGLAHVEQSSDEPIRVEVGSCAVLEHETGVTRCADGDVVVVAPDAAQAPAPGTEYVLGEPGTGGTPWQLPADARTVEVTQDGSMTPASGFTPPWIFVTPSALGDAVLTGGYVPVMVALDSADPDAVDRLRTAAAQIDPTAYVASREQESLTGALGSVRQALLIGTIALLVVVGASLLVNVAEQLRERRRPLAVLAAFGTRRRTLGLSVLWQVTIPVALGITLAAATGTGLSAALQAGVDAPIGIDWRTIALTSGGAALVVLLVTTLSLPLLARLTRADALHAE